MLNYCIVKQRIGAITEDAPDDDDRYPDYTSVFGQVVFAPTMANGSAYKITDDDGVVHTVPATRINAQIVNGEITHEGLPGLPLFAAGPNANPSTIVYTATYSNLTAAGRPVDLNSITFRAVPGETIDLSSYTPVAGAPTPGIIQGPPGHTPFIGQNGNWWINGVDTDVAATSPIVHSYTELKEAFEENTIRVEALEAMNGVSPESPVDGQTANLITQQDTLTRAAIDSVFPERLSESSLNATIGEKVQPIANRGSMPGIFSLLSGTEDEVLSSVNPANSRSADKVNFKVGGQAWKSATTFAGSLLQQYTETKSIPPFQAVSLWVYVEDASLVSDIGVRLYFDETYTTKNRWWWAFQANSPKHTIVTGWNLLRIPADWGGGNISDLSTIYRWEVYAVVTGGTSVTFGHLYLETPAKAKCIIVADRGYQRFYNGLYQDLKQRGIPVTFAVDVTLFGTGTTGLADEAMSESLMHQVAQENGNSISFHGYDGAPTAHMTPEQLRVDTAKSIKWLQRHGYSGRMWRAAYVQGAALKESHDAAKGMLVGSSSPFFGGVPSPWPPKDRHDIPRYGMDNNQTDAAVTGWFDLLKKSHMLAVIFVHSEGDQNQYDYSPAKRAHFLAQIDRGISEGWLEFHTYESLFHQSGGVFRSLGGAHVAEFTDESGERVVQNVM